MTRQREACASVRSNQRDRDGDGVMLGSVMIYAAILAVLALTLVWRLV